MENICRGSRRLLDILGSPSLPWFVRPARVPIMGEKKNERRGLRKNETSQEETRLKEAEDTGACQRRCTSTCIRLEDERTERRGLHDGKGRVSAGTPRDDRGSRRARVHSRTGLRSRIRSDDIRHSRTSFLAESLMSGFRFFFFFEYVCVIDVCIIHMYVY